MVLMTVALKLKMKKKTVGLPEIQGAGDPGSFYGHVEARTPFLLQMCSLNLESGAGALAGIERGNPWPRRAPMSDPGWVSGGRVPAQGRMRGPKKRFRGNALANLYIFDQKMASESPCVGRNDSKSVFSKSPTR